MTFSDVVRVGSVLLQVAVACYALRLSSRFGTTRVGWMIFGAFTLLAVVHSILAISPFRASAEAAMLPDITYALVAVLLLISTGRLEKSLQKRWQVEVEANRNLTAWESHVENQAAELSKVNAELLKSDARLQAELAEQKQLRAEKESTYESLLMAARQTENDLLQSVSTLQAKFAGQEERIAAECQARIAAVAVRLHESLGALGLFARDQARSRSASLVHAARLIQTRSAGSTASSRAKKFPEALAHLARHMTDDLSALLQKIESFRNEVAQIAESSAASSGPAPVEPESISESPQEAQAPADYREHVIDNVTETATETASETIAADPATTPTEQAAETSLNPTEAAK